MKRTLPIKNSKNLLLRTLTVASFSFLSGISFAQDIYYVKSGGAGSGTSWADASGDLQEMINTASVYDSIFVAEGTYIPNRRADDTGTITTNDRDNAFVLKSYVKIFGGFAATGSPGFNERDWVAYPTVLSGDFNQDDIVTGAGSSLTFSNNTENAYHVIISSGSVGSAELNGFTVSGGNADGNGTISVNGHGFPGSYGAGVYNYYSSPTLTNVIISNNAATSLGGGMRNITASPTLTNVTFNNNSATYGGAALQNHNYCSPTLTNVVISNNLTSSGPGGGIYNFYSSPTLTNVTISSNAASSYGGGIYNTTSSSYFPTMTNCLIFGNTSNTYPGVCNIDASMYSNSLIQNLSDNTNGNINATGILATDIFSDFTSGDYSLQLTCSNPAINAGDNTALTPGITSDIIGNNRIISGTVDLGAYEAPAFNFVLDAGSDTTICAGNSIALTATGMPSMSYSWNNGIGVSDTAYISPATTTTYIVSGVGCFPEITDTITVHVNTLPSVFAGNDQIICDGQDIILAGSGALNYLWNNGISNGVAFTPVIGTTSYTVIGTDINGCESSDDIVITVNDLPTVDAGMDQTFCEGEQVTLSASGASNYTWNNGISNGVPFTPSVGATDYIVSVTDANNCSNSDTVLVTVYALPSNTVTQTNLILTADATAGYQWIDCNTNAYISGETNQSYNITANGSYAVIVESQFGCADTSDCITIADLNIDELTTEQLAVYPNPTYGKVTIAFSSKQELVTITVLDVTGKQVAVYTESNCKEVLFSINEPAGVYYLNISTPQGSVVQKMISHL